MHPRDGLGAILCFVLLMASSSLAAQTEPGGGDRADAVPAPLPKLLFVTQSKGFVHPVVKRAERAMLAHAERCLAEAAKGRWVVECTQDISKFPEGMDGVSALVFYTTGELPLDDAQRQLLLRWIEKGGAFIGVHSATDTFYKWPAYGELIGGYFDGHPWNEDVTVRIEDATHPITTGLGESFVLADEIYQFRNFDRKRVKVLLSLDPNSIAIEKGKRKDRDYALAWCREYGKGRVFYTALGHRPAVWRNAAFMEVLLRGIDWSARRELMVAATPEPKVVWQDLLAKGLVAWRPVKGEKTRWKLEGGVLEVAPSSSSLMTHEAFGDCRLQLEFAFPEGTPERGGDSGVVLQHNYEIQILDGRGVTTPSKQDCGAIYGLVAPAAHAGRGPAEWQRLEILFRAARYDESGKKTENARVTVDLNGVRVQDDVEIPDRTVDQRPEGPGERSLVLEDRGERVRFRKVRIARIDEVEERMTVEKAPTVGVPATGTQKQSQADPAKAAPGKAGAGKGAGKDARDA